MPLLLRKWNQHWLRIAVAIASMGLVIGLVAASAAGPPTHKTLPPAAKQTIDFGRDIEPIFKQRCSECHGPKKQESSFRIDLRDRLIHGGDSGEPAVVAGHSDQSRLIKFVAHLDPDTVMPPQGEPLSDLQIGLLRAWIDQGAKISDRSTTDSSGVTTAHWSFQPIKNVAPPAIKDPWIAGPIDAFVLEKLRGSGIKPSPQSDRVSLIRRVYLDMLGLPPAPAQIDRFVRDSGPQAYAHLVDEVLNSPRYGERWARHWLDVIRFADTDGYETNVERPNAYHFRDYLIRALNEDRPWDRMIVEQLAGDAVGEDAATGFIVGGGADRVKSPNELLTRTQRQDELADMIGTTGSSMLGLTVGCARCHDHKFDPIPQRDYYALQAVFAGVQHEERPLRWIDGKDMDSEHLVAIKPGSKRPPVNARRNEEHFSPTPARAVRFTILATNDNAEPCIDELEICEAGTKNPARNVALASVGGRASSSGNYEGNTFHKLDHINDGLYGNERSWISNERGRGWIQIDLPKMVTIDRIVWGRDRQKQFTDRLPIQYKIEISHEPNRWEKVASWEDHEPYTSPATPERMVYGGRFVQPGPTYRLNRGDPMQPREQVGAEGLSALKPLLGSLGLPPDAPEQQRRLALAHCIARPDNPLTARVIVNRLWHYHFGNGIVATPSDFGRMGTPPTHPELLDWLATELVRNGWRLKPIHRLILLSNTYRQSSLPNPRGLAADAGDRFLWRYPPRRLEAEAIRDSILESSDVLDLTMYGKGFSAFEPNDNYVRVYVPKETWGPADWRRMVYMNKVRREQDGVFGAFDAPDAGQVCPRRSRSTTPLQALNLLNSSFLVQQSDLLARRVERESRPETLDHVRRAFLITLGRTPSSDEAAAGEKLIRQHGLPSLCRALFNANEFLFIP
jgi:mono/diheme cytochrome c family protein